jgi:two-component system, response regulator PdtaR
MMVDLGEVVRRIAIVEDEALLAMDMEATLEEAGHVVVGIADSYETALSLLTKLPDLALLDINLYDGPSGLRIASLFTGKGIQCLFVSGNCPDATTALAAGCLAKPVNGTILRAAVDVASSLRAGQRPEVLPYGMTLF